MTAAHGIGVVISSAGVLTVVGPSLIVLFRALRDDSVPEAFRKQRLAQRNTSDNRNGLGFGLIMTGFVIQYCGRSQAVDLAAGALYGLACLGIWLGNRRFPHRGWTSAGSVIAVLALVTSDSRIVQVVAGVLVILWAVAFAVGRLRPRARV